MLGLYIHIPFCVQKCKYCDFNSYKMIVNEKDRFLSDLKKEMALYKNKDRKINSIFSGGGTPSILNNNDMQFIMDEIKENFSIDEDAEISIAYEKVMIKCHNCGFEGKFINKQYVCPSCGKSDYKIVKGREFYIDTMEVE